MKRIVVAGVVVALAACGGGSKTTCVEGATQQCLCVGVRTGVQVCQPGGKAWGDCQGCDGSGDATFVMPPDALEGAVLYWLSPPPRHPPPAVASQKVLRVPEDHATIQGAIDAGADGDHVLVGPGRYEEALRFPCRSIVVRSAEGPQETIIDAAGQGSVAYFSAPDGADGTCGGRWQTVLTGFTLTGGSGTEMLHEGGTQKQRQGGGVHSNGRSPILAWNVIEGNTGTNGGGILCDARCEALIAYNWVRHNSAEKGGGIRISNASPVVVNNVIEANVAARLGGGIYWRCRSSPIISLNTVIGNRAGEKGGGIFGSNHPPGSRFVTVANNIIAGNTAPFGEAMVFNLATTVVHLTHNLVSGGRGAVRKTMPEVQIEWEPTNLSADPDAGEMLPPRPGFPGEAKGDIDWARFLEYDFLGQPRLSGGEPLTVDIGAIQATNGTISKVQWP